MCQHTVDTQSKFVRMSLTKYLVHNLGVTLCVNTTQCNIKCKFGWHIIAVQIAQETSGQPRRGVLSLNITQRCQNPTNVMTYAPAAKTDKPTDWKALWISFGDGACSKKNDSHGSDLSFNRSSLRGECGLCNDGTCL